MGRPKLGERGHVECKATIGRVFFAIAEGMGTWTEAAGSLCKQPGADVAAKAPTMRQMVFSIVRRGIGVAALSAATFAMAGCGGATGDPDANGGDGQPLSNPVVGETPEHTGGATGTEAPDLIPPSFEGLRFVSEGGYVPVTPEGSPCIIGEHDTMTLVNATRELSWSQCIWGDGVQLEEGARTLSDDEFAEVIAALASVEPSSVKNCGADAGVALLDVTLASGVLRYADDFYSGCPWDVHEGRAFVSGLNGLGGTLYQLTR